MLCRKTEQILFMHLENTDYKSWCFLLRQRMLCELHYLPPKVWVWCWKRNHSRIWRSRRWRLLWSLEHSSQCETTWYQLMLQSPAAESVQGFDHVMCLPQQWLDCNLRIHWPPCSDVWQWEKYVRSSKWRRWPESDIASRTAWPQKPVKLSICILMKILETIVGLIYDVMNM